MRSIKVRLVTDLTRYHPELVPGLEGVTVGRLGFWSRENDQFISVRFPSVGVMDILWKSLEIVDEAYLKQVAEDERKRWEYLRRAKDVTRTIGPRGGFRSLSYRYVDEDGVGHNVSLYDKREAERIVQFLQESGIEVTEVRVR